CEKFNALIKGTAFDGRDAEEIIAELENVPEEIKQGVRNNGGGYVNHNFFWKILSPEKQEPTGELYKRIKEVFGSIDEFKKLFKEVALSRFGSGWAWLVVEPDGKLVIYSTANQDSPLTEGKKPILCLDVWEHAYYLKYQNKRADYVDAFWNVVNWKMVGELYAESVK
ncbi:MAG: superoxide dismutase, partial [Deltaproteobacteria bacterium]|nr:superoxide dismutase [Deltaproteobacteria bacterium]